MPTVQVALPQSDYDRLVEAAKARDLATVSLIRLLLTGALNLGGGTFDRLLVEGEKRTTMSITRRFRSKESDWQKIGEQHWQHVSGEWEMVKFAPPKNSKLRAVKEAWWHLSHVGSPDLTPLAFEFRDALREAQYIMDSSRRMT